jgi:predicted nucleic acid-binding protein
MESVYIETSIISYLVAKPSNNLITAARQKITFDWWNNQRHKYNIFISELVVAEAIKGDKLAAKERLKVIKTIPVLEITNECIELAKLFFKKAKLSENARDDALHIAIATSYKMDFLLTWNFRHLANAHFIRKLQKISLEEGLIIPTICTPQEIDDGR